VTKPALVATLAASALGLSMLTFAIQTAPLAGAEDKAKAAAPAAGAPFQVDAVHSSVLFRIKHMNTSWFYGRFNDVSGSFSMNGDAMTIDISVKADSVDTANKKRDEHVVGNDFFSAKEFPTISFKADKLARSGDAFTGTGSLTFRGVTKPIDVTITPTGTGTNRGGKPIAGFEAKATFKRSDFGNSYMIGPLSDEIGLIVSIQGAQN
jgi:polyisoprenoid-binding protein YceI